MTSVIQIVDYNCGEPGHARTLAYKIVLSGVVGSTQMTLSRNSPRRTDVKDFGR